MLIPKPRGIQYLGRYRHLVELAIRDGAEVVYLFNEAAGDLQNATGVSAYDLQVDANVVRETRGWALKDYLGYQFTTAAGAAPLFNHCEGDRPSLNTGPDFTSEIICRRTSGLTANDRLMEARTGGGFSSFTWLIDSSSRIACGCLSGAGNNPNNQIVGSTAAEALDMAHYAQVWESAAKAHRVYRNGVLKQEAILANSGAIFESGSVRKIAVGGLYQLGSANSDSEIEFFAIYPFNMLTIEQAEEHYAAARISI